MENPRPEPYPGLLIRAWRDFATQTGGKISQYTLADLYLRESDNSAPGEDIAVARRRLRVKIGNYESNITPVPQKFLEEVAELLNIPSEMRRMSAYDVQYDYSEKPYLVLKPEILDAYKGRTSPAYKLRKTESEATAGLDVERLTTQLFRTPADLWFKASSYPVLNATMLCVGRDGARFVGNISARENTLVLSLIDRDAHIPIDELTVVGILFRIYMENVEGIKFPSIINNS